MKVDHYYEDSREEPMAADPVSKKYETSLDLNEKYGYWIDTDHIFTCEITIHAKGDEIEDIYFDRVKIYDNDGEYIENNWIKNEVMDAIEEWVKAEHPYISNTYGLIWQES